MSRAFGITPAAFSKWPVSPVEKRGRENLYYLPDCIAVKRAQDTKGNLDLTDERARLTKNQADKAELDVEVMRGHLIPSDVVAEVWNGAVANFRARMIGLPSTAAPRVAGCEMQECESEIRDLVFEALDELKDYAGSDYKSENRDESIADGLKVDGPTTGSKRKRVGGCKPRAVKRIKRGAGPVED